MAKNDGRYVHVAGKDGPGSVAPGKYVHVAGKDGPGSVAAGKYVHVAGKDGPGAQPYTGEQNPGGQYTGGQNPGGQIGIGAGSIAAKTTKKPVVAVATTPRTIVTQGVPPDGWKIIRDEKTETIDGYHYL